MSQCDLQTFQGLFAVALEAAGKKDESGMLAQLYWELLSPSDPTGDEVWAAIAAHVDNHGSRLPTGRDLKEFIWNARKTEQKALPQASDVKVCASKEAHLTVLATVLKHQGDTPFYRQLLGSKAGVWSRIVDPRGTVTHEEVLEVLEF
jgi:hypothetical protein